MKRRAHAIDAALADLEQRHLRRERATVVAFAEPGNRLLARVGTQQLVDFSSNDYLGLAHHPALAIALAECAARCGTGSAASHLVTGHGVEHAALEEELAAYTGRERALLFSTGYMANLAAIGCLAGRGEWVLMDRLSHASLLDAALLCGARLKRYAHGDALAAERGFCQAGDAATVIATDGLFSMDGDLAPLTELAALAQRHTAWLVVDDAHGLGVLGDTGRGSLERLGLGAAEVPVLVGTLGKAFGCFGAFIAGRSDLIELLIQTARTYRYTTALPQAVAAAARKALSIAQKESWRRERLHALTARFRAAARALDVPLTASDTPIQPIVVGEPQAALDAQRELAACGFWVVAIRPPTVPPGSARLRVTLSAAHTESQVDALAERLGAICTRG